MSKVGECIREGYTGLQRKGLDCILEWNSGNHFKEPDLRTAKAAALYKAGRAEGRVCE